ncbi:tRNA pseudouridine(38-40) synthase TruA [Natronogracilivirga saccharolytica]|uniref:tRNA pseudouridine synthase A n=1 Tax=Natronogracilivirga saccharolytica TaxID=2812953 RepID=A0A8J7S625_9BACT|nr:tRNA pseudouridine(38-40) synthase TruA [Natronogracilivirga saccharolytica]MBP3192628.1 tRNA pseudouridine(38-40) synthase TruA [Natronogracilivirga saccharolytica]
MPRYLIELAYDGTQYRGWQKQPDTRTVQGEVEQALQTVIQEDIRLYGSGRTDAGVHALHQCAHFDTFIPVEEDWLVNRLGRILDDDLYIHAIREVPEHFHARFDAGWREYRYQLLLRPDPFKRLYAWYPGDGMAWEAMGECLHMLQGEMDFAGFSRKTPDLPHTRCTVFKAEMTSGSDSVVVIRLQANRFLRSMVRSLVGGLVTVGIGKKNIDWFRIHLKEGREIDNIALAPARGLFLQKVFYPDSVLDLT